MGFILQSDFERQITTRVLNEITNNNFTLCEQEELPTIQEVIAFIGSRYDTDKVFAPIVDYNNLSSFSYETRIKYIEPAYVGGTVYGVGDRVSYTDGNIYECIQITTGSEDPTNSAFWQLEVPNGELYHVINEDGTTAGSKPNEATDDYKKGDTRNPLIVRILVDMILYHINARINPRNISQIRIDRYDEAKEILRGVNSGKMTNISLPERVNDDDTPKSIVTGSNIKLTHYY